MKELAPKLALKQKTKKALKSALIGDDLSQKSVPELISAGFEEESSDDDSEDTAFDEEDDDMEEDAEMDLDEDQSSAGEDGDSEEDSDDESDSGAGLGFVPKGKIEGVSMSAQNQLMRQKLLERINMARTGRKVAPVDSEGNILVEQTPHSKRRDAKAKKQAKKGAEPELSRRQQKNLKKRARKEEALKAAPKAPKDDPYAIDSDTDQKPAPKKVKTVEENLEFGNMRFEDGHAKSHFEKIQDKGLSKEKQLAKLLREKAHEAKLEGTEEGEKLKEDKAWSKTFQRMAGEKVKDRADLLKKALRKEESSKKKSTKEWTERKAAVKLGQDDRTKKRNANIKERLETHKLKKVGKKAPKKGKK